MHRDPDCRFPGEASHPYLSMSPCALITSAQAHCSVPGGPPAPALLVERFIFPPLLCTFVKNRSHIFAWTYSRVFCSVPLIYASIPPPTAHSLDYCVF